MSTDPLLALPACTPPPGYRAMRALAATFPDNEDGRSGFAFTPDPVGAKLGTAGGVYLRTSEGGGGMALCFRLGEEPKSLEEARARLWVGPLAEVRGQVEAFLGRRDDFVDMVFREAGN